MHQPAGLVRIFQQRPASIASRSVLFVFFTAQLLFSMDLGFFAALKPRLRCAARVTSLLVTASYIMAFVYILFSSEDSSLFGARCFDIFHLAYFCVVIISLKFCKYSLYQFLKDLSEIDCKWNVIIHGSNIGIQISICLLLVLSVLFRVIYLLIFKDYIFNGSFFITFKYTVIHIVYTFMDILPIVNILFYYNVFVRLRYLRTGFEKLELESRKVEAIFTSIAYCTFKKRESLDIQVVLAFAVDIVRWVGIIYFYLVFTIKNYKITEIPLYMLLFLLATIVTLVLQVCVPALYAESIASEMDAARAAVHERLLVENDGREISELTRLLRCLEARPLLRPAWRLVPLGLRMPVVMFGVCASYIIMLVQFSHLTD